MKEEIIKKYVEEVLIEIPETRDNDTLLQFNVLMRMNLARIDGTMFQIDMRNMDSLPSFETIRRIRQFIQSPKGENRLYPSEEVEERRHKKEEQYHENYLNKYTMAETMPNSWMS
jgi:hypothetical protein